MILHNKLIEYINMSFILLFELAIYIYVLMLYSHPILMYFSFISIWVTFLIFER